MEKKYQVFVSSTYRDLQEERQEVMQALLELDCIPVGMELFPAANDDQWTLIKKLIDDCDYYVLIVGGKYGSVNIDGVSYTQIEYEYALEKQIPVISFLPKDPDKLIKANIDLDPSLQNKLESFKKIVEKKMCRYWENASDLGSQVSRSLIKLIKSHPRTGWVKADLVPTEDTTKEILSLKNQITDLEKELGGLKQATPVGIENLMQGNDVLEINYRYKIWQYTAWQVKSEKKIISWDEIFYLLSPLMVDEASESALMNGLNKNFRDNNHKFVSISSDDISDLHIVDSDFQTIKIQLRALGLISQSLRKRSIKDTSTYWTLTPYGDKVMVKLRALSKNVNAL